MICGGETRIMAEEKSQFLLSQTPAARVYHYTQHSQSRSTPLSYTQCLEIFIIRIAIVATIDSEIFKRYALCFIISFYSLMTELSTLMVYLLLYFF